MLFFIRKWYHTCMKRLFSVHDCEYYSHLLNLLEHFNLDENFKWLLTDIEAYPHDYDLDLKFTHNEYVICTHKELISWLRQDDFQWIWGVLSLFKPETIDDDILRYELPGIRDEHPGRHLFDDNKPVVQHPLAILELDAGDSAFLCLSSKEDKYIEIFKLLYPKSVENI